MPKSKKTIINPKNKGEPTEWKKAPRTGKLQKTRALKLDDIHTLNELHKILELLKCDVPLSIHEHVSKEEVLKTEKHCYEWAKSLGLISKKTTNTEFKGSKFGRLICYIFPTTTFKRRCLAIDFFNWLFFVDDLIDNNKDLKGKPEEIKIVLDKFKAILDDKPKSEDLQSPIAIALRDVWARIKIITTKAWQLKFCNSISLYFDACCVNAQNELTNNIPNSVDAYIKIRRNSGAVMTSFNLIEPLLGIQISYDNPDLQNLMDYCNDHICFTNDLYSLQKELKEGEIDNIIIVLHRLHRYSLQEAIIHTVDLANKRMTQIQEISNRLINFNLDIDQNVNKCVNALLNIIVGSLYWHKSSGRYSTKKNETGGLRLSM
ncbi:15489_t:CDS:1 [Cetraspora pellucida]|uniref:Terpene synthase n=1 Tax=Cetraspora pellucida TaxID=1433469 RepID=A0A9N9E7R3_9GLOM|nr:15489_t:CDS:1 [Cetraspora pellucida]